MPRTSLLAPLTLTLALASTACPGAETKKTDGKVEAKTDPKAATPPADEPKRDPGTSLDKAVTATDLAGPVPPEASAVFFAVDGALIPVGCYLHDKKKIGSGKDCLKVVKAGDEVYLKSKDSENLDKIGAPKAAMCEVGGAGDPTSLRAASPNAGATFDFGAARNPFARQIVVIPEESWSDKKPTLTAEETAAIAGIAKVEGELTVRQVAIQDLDGDGTPEKIVSVAQINPKDSERLSVSGVYVQRGGAWTTVETTKNDTLSYTVRAAIDLDGDRKHELWINSVSTEGGGGDRIYQLTATGGTGLGKWTCGT